MTLKLRKIKVLMNIVPITTHKINISMLSASLMNGKRLNNDIVMLNLLYTVYAFDGSTFFIIFNYFNITKSSV